MMCPNCFDHNSEVAKTESYFDYRVKVRLRRCRSCGHCFNTKEEILCDEPKTFSSVTVRIAAFEPDIPVKRSKSKIEGI